MITRGIRNNNPFNIRLSQNSWKGKIAPFKNTDKEFEQFKTMRYGLRAGFLLLRNYISKGYNTVEKIINRFAPASENNVVSYIAFICENSSLTPSSSISLNSLTFYWLCQNILRYESHYELDYNTYLSVMKEFRLI